METWRDIAQRVIARVDAVTPQDTSRTDYARALRNAYPFGERANWPYKVWLLEQRAALERRFPGSTRPPRAEEQKRRQDRNQTEMDLRM